MKNTKRRKKQFANRINWSFNKHMLYLMRILVSPDGMADGLLRWYKYTYGDVWAISNRLNDD